MLEEVVTQPIKAYIRSRKAALRRIIDLITENAALQSQLGNQQVRLPSQQDEGVVQDLSSDEDEEAAEKWQPLTTAALDKKGDSETQL